MQENENGHLAGRFYDDLCAFIIWESGIKVLRCSPMMNRETPGVAAVPAGRAPYFAASYGSAFSCERMGASAARAFRRADAACVLSSSSDNSFFSGFEKNRLFFCVHSSSYPFSI